MKFFHYLQRNFIKIVKTSKSPKKFNDEIKYLAVHMSNLISNYKHIICKNITCLCDIFTNMVLIY